MDEAATLVVGESDQQAKFTVHKNILSAASPFFEAACKLEWMKAQGRVIKHPDDDLEAVRALVYWMYGNRICVSKDILTRGPLDEFTPTNQEAMVSPWGLFVKLYVLGEEYQIPRLRNHAIDAILHFRTKCDLELGVTPYVYQHTTSKASPLRFLMVRIAKCESNDDEIEDFGNQLCSEF